MWGIGDMKCEHNIVVGVREELRQFERLMFSLEDNVNPYPANVEYRVSS